MWNFISFSCIVEREQMTLFHDDLGVKKCAHALSKSSLICIIEDDKKFLFSFNRSENQFLHVIPKYPMNRNRTSTNLNLSSFYP